MKSRNLGLAVVSALLVVACGGGSDGGDVLEGDKVTVLMFDDRFDYTEIRIPVGGSVDWIGAGANAHNAVASDGEWSTEEVWGDLEQFDGDSAILTYDQAGEYVFFCTFHGNSGGSGMAGKLVVGA